MFYALNAAHTGLLRKFHHEFPGMYRCQADSDNGTVYRIAAVIKPRPSFVMFLTGHSLGICEPQRMSNDTLVRGGCARRLLDASGGGQEIMGKRQGVGPRHQLRTRDSK